MPIALLLQTATMNDPSAAPLFTGVVALLSSFLGVLGKMQWDRVRSNGNGHAKSSTTEQVNQVLSEREQIVFQTTMKMMVESLSKSLGEMHEQYLGQMGEMTTAVKEAALSIREVHEELKSHRGASEPMMEQIAEMHRKVMTIKPSEVGSLAPPR